jgi:beta-glucosidase
MENGEDSHFAWGKNQTYPGNNREYHLKPFRDVIAAGVAQMMPYYSRPIGTDWEEVAFRFNRGVVTDLLKGELDFEGVVVTDWNIVQTRHWGIEDLSELERTRRVIAAGCDIFGGADGFPELIVQLVCNGIITEERIDYSVRKLMRQRSEIGLFHHPFVDENIVAATVANPYFVHLGKEYQRRTFTLLTNINNFLPLLGTSHTAKMFYIEGINSTVLEKYNIRTVATPEKANYAILRLRSPFKPTTLQGALGEINNGTLEYSDE